MRSRKATFNIAVLALVAAVSGCSGELTDNASPVELVATNSQNLQILDLDPAVAAADPDCAQDIGTINLQVFAKRSGVTGNAASVRVTRYRVSYQRTDGGRLVPAPFVRSMDTLIGIGDESDVSEFLVVEPDAIIQAPFASLLPQNGGRDPDTGRPIVKMDVIMEFFGETLGGSNVYDATRFPLDFCYGTCGCS
ncbi:MAG TPA: hypothetical protein VF432_15655 [Thermoanaerobaculia bacterium]